MVLTRFPVVRYRWLLYEMVVRDLKLRYRGSVLGFAWTLLNPLLFMALYTFVFSVILRSQIHWFALFLLSGMIPWMWISTAIGQAVTAVQNGGGYIGKTLMPAELLVLVPVLSNGVNFLITIALLFPVCMVLGINVGWAMLCLPVLVFLGLCLTLGVAFFVATIDVFFRDVQQIVNYALIALFFLTPIFYAKGSVPQNLQFLVTFNPFAGLISAYQSVFYAGRLPNGQDLILPTAFGLTVLVLGFAYFNRNRDAFGEYV